MGGGGGINLRLGDSSGVTNISIRNYTNSQVAYIDSLGKSGFNSSIVGQGYTYYEGFGGDTTTSNASTGDIKARAIRDAQAWMTDNSNAEKLRLSYNNGGFGGGATPNNVTMFAGNTAVFDTTTVNANSKGFQGAVFDGRYVYFVPYYNGQVTRYDTTGSFTAAGSYSVFDTTTVNANSRGFVGAVFDGRYVYLVPYNNGQVTRYDTTGSFTAAGSYSVFDTTTVNANSKGFHGAVFDGRYVYFVPYSNGAYSGQVTRYDTTGSFTAAGSYSVFDTTTVNANSKGFNGAVFDGRYVYFVPEYNGAYSGQVTRYDTTGSFTAAGSYSVFDTTTVNANSKGFVGAVFDGRYVYFVPCSNGAYSGQVTRYDTTGSFTAAGSYSVFDTTTVNANSKGFFGAVFDGRYVYFVPYYNGAYSGQVTRIKGYAGGIDSTVSVEKIARSENFYINAQGNVSIGTTQGLAKLQVNGTLLFPSLAGGTLTTDALGNVYVVSNYMTVVSATNPNWDAKGYNITNVNLTPSSGTDAATKNYVDIQKANDTSVDAKDATVTAYTDSNKTRWGSATLNHFFMSNETVFSNVVYPLNHVLNSTTVMIDVICIGGGGGSGGVTGVASQTAGSGGGGAGGYAEAWFSVVPSTTVWIGVGGGGVGGAAGNNNGLAGKPSNLTVPGGTKWINCSGGLGGTGQAAGTTFAGAAGGIGGGTVVMGAVSPQWINYGMNQTGMNGYRLSATAAIPGSGGSTTLGDGAIPPTAAGAGTACPPGGYGGGAAGALSTAAVNQAGGAGCPGVIILREYAM
jgi:uncharacterized membrane protein